MQPPWIRFILLSVFPLLNLAFAFPADAGHALPSTDVVIPTVFESGHFYANPELANGKHMHLLLDTGGGGYPTPFVSQAQADLLGLHVDHACEVNGATFGLASPSFVDGQALPEISESCRGVLVVPTLAKQAADGQIGPTYLKRAVWTFDYPKRQVVLRGSSWHPSGDAHKTPLGFKPLSNKKFAGWPRITVEVDGAKLDMLLDTGATAKPTAEALKESPERTTDGIGVGSYIVESIMSQWRTKHPDWQVIEKGDALFPAYPRMIRVPDVQIAGWHVGPVWFIERPDSAFHAMMAAMMDRPPEGAIGANVFEHFRMTIDYKQKTAWFECVSDCSASSRHASIER